MMAGSLLILLDDIATVLDDVSVLTKVAAKKTAGVLGDDLALNAQQVTGVRADRELAVVWAVAKGSFVNKCILVPTALVISAVAPVLIAPLLMIGGLFLCFEGSEKIIHKFAPQLLPHHDDEDAHQAHLEANANGEDLVKLEKDKIKGAIRTDFILSAEIVVISLGTVATATLTLKALTLCAIAIIMTVGVYGLVAMIVKMDDVGFHLASKPEPASQKMGNLLLAFAPKLMKFLSIAGTLAMFLVGGGILVHGVGMLHHQAEHLSHLSGVFGGLTENLYNGVVGFVAGCIIVAVVALFTKLKSKNY
ncbi:MAG: DUF808 domain-containing protein [Moraxella sp.]|uniref:DUF808 domain-containing protein n=1 Tax=Moraxella sp. TaxID=479 RepID=UPI0026DC7C3C|nr:DUF808 domain-containing protein [Moraxella sp.]MDO4450887.1 DUF808 domain-containing protein [Moraxella sp.]